MSSEDNKNIVVATRHLSNLTTELKIIEKHLSDPTVTDIMINADQRIWVKKAGENIRSDGVSTVEQTRRIILFTASLIKQTVDASNPELDGIIPLPSVSARISAVVEPWTIAPTICIRKASPIIYDLGSYIQKKLLSQKQKKEIVNAINAHKNIVISGGTGSGKTTFLNALIKQVSDVFPHERLYSVEDTPEIQCQAENAVQLVVPPNMTDRAVRKALRFFPNRIIFGELRHGDTTKELLKAWNTGHPGGLTTIHANSSEDVISRMTALLGEAMADYNERLALVRHTIDLIVHMGEGARVMEIKKILKGKGDEK